MTQRQRRAVLEDLVQRRRPVRDCQRDLGAYPWDSDRDLVTLTPTHLTRLLRDFVRGEVDEADCEDWANAIECRDDLGFDPATADVLNELTFELANPGLTRPLTVEAAERWLAVLGVEPEPGR